MKPDAVRFAWSLGLAASLAALAACASVDAAGKDLSSSEVSLVAGVAGREPIVGAGLCPPQPFQNCDVYRLVLTRASRNLDCPLIAITFTDETGHPRSSWNASLLEDRTRRWRMTARRVAQPYCHYSLIDASPEVP